MKSIHLISLFLCSTVTFNVQSMHGTRVIVKRGMGSMNIPQSVVNHCRPLVRRIPSLYWELRPAHIDTTFREGMFKLLPELQSDHAVNSALYCYLLNICDAYKKINQHSRDNVMLDPISEIEACNAIKRQRIKSYAIGATAGALCPVLVVAAISAIAASGFESFVHINQICDWMLRQEDITGYQLLADTFVKLPLMWTATAGLGVAAAVSPGVTIENLFQWEEIMEKSISDNVQILESYLNQL